MSLLSLVSATRRRRYRQITSAFARHGLGVLTAGIGLPRLIPFHWGILGHARRGTPYSSAEHIRLSFEELGTTAIKIGQILSTRPDLLPPNMVAELEKLRDRVPPVPTDAVIEVIEQELGGPIGETFDSFDREPLASASIGQVHAGRLHDGTEVVVKVRKPGVAESVDTDLEILARLAGRVATIEAESAYDVEELAADFAWTLRSELDYRLERRNANQLREILASDPRAIVPRIHDGLTTEAVLVMDRIWGTPIDDVEAIVRMGVDPGAVARAHAEILLHQVFEVGFFHADPHPGNFLVTDDGRIAILDFGMVGRLEEPTRRSLVRLLIAVARQDTESMALALEALGMVRRPGAQDALRRDLHRMMDRYYGLAVDEYSFSDYLTDLLGVVRRRRLQLPSDLALLFKTVGMSDGLWRRLDPSFNAWTIGESFVRRLALRLYSVPAVTKRLLEVAAHLTETITTDGYRSASPRGNAGTDELITAVRRQVREGANQVARAVSAAGLAIALALITIAYRPPAWSFLAPILFFGGAAVLLAVVIRMVIAGRSRRPP
jgi:ubiquinone biosynthesis protein